MGHLRCFDGVCISWEVIEGKGRSNGCYQSHYMLDTSVEVTKVMYFVNGVGVSSPSASFSLA